MSKINNPKNSEEKERKPIDLIPNELDYPDGKIPETDDPIIRFKMRNREIIITYLFPKVTITKLEFTPSQDQFTDKKFRLIKLSNVGFMTESGKALLPSLGRFVQIPPGYYAKIKNVSKSGAKAIHEKGKNLRIITSQEELTETSYRERHFEYSKDFYNSRDWYPSERDMVKLDGPFDVDGYNAVLLHVRPLKYKPSTLGLIAYSKIVVTLEIKPCTEPKQNCTYNFEDIDKQAFGDFFINSDREGIEDKFGVEVRCPKPELKDKDDPEFLIICHPDFEDAAKKLQYWKKDNESGPKLETEIISTEDKDVGRSSYEIKSYIRFRRKPKEEDGKLTVPRLRYVLLLGNSDFIETEYFNYEGYGSFPSDYYYSTRVDPDERNVQKCILPWLALGRIPVKDNKEAECVVEKIIEYEKNSRNNDKEKRKISLVASFQDTDTALDNPKPDKRACRRYIMTMEKISKGLKNICSFEKIYVNPVYKPEYLQHFYVTQDEIDNYNKKDHKYIDGSDINDDVIKIFKEKDEARIALMLKILAGQMIIAHRGHSSFDGWGHPNLFRGHIQDIKKELLNEINNNKKVDADVREKFKEEYQKVKNLKGLSVFFSTNCSAGRFGRTEARKSFAEELLFHEYGAASLIAATDRSRTWRNDSLLKALFDGLWKSVLFPEGKSNPIRNFRLGDIMNYAKTYLLLEHNGMNIGNRAHFEIFHVIGDPTLQLMKSSKNKS